MSYEIEFKFLLPGEREFERLDAHLSGLALPKRGPRVQLNHFFDTPGRALQAQRCALRLREESGRFLLTAKGAAEEPSVDGASLQHEVQAVISPELAQDVLAGRGSPLAALLAAGVDDPEDFLPRLEAHVADRALAEIGHFTNRRSTHGPLALASGAELEFELDRTELPGRVDHELEVEVERSWAAEARSFVQQTLRDLEIETTPATSKAQRFFELSS